MPKSFDKDKVFYGYKFEKDLKELHKMKECIDRTECYRTSYSRKLLILGGSKFESKKQYIKKLAKKFDTILIGCPLTDNDREFINNINHCNRIEILDQGEGVNDINCSGDLLTHCALDKLKFRIDNHGIVFWNGCLGMYEKQDCRGSLDFMMDMITVLEDTRTFAILGGDTIAHCYNHYLSENMKNVKYQSTAGGAALAYLTGKEMPGLEPLDLSSALID